MSISSFSNPNVSGSSSYLNNNSSSSSGSSGPTPLDQTTHDVGTSILNEGSSSRSRSNSLTRTNISRRNSLSLSRKSSFSISSSSSGNATASSVDQGSFEKIKIQLDCIHKILNESPDQAKDKTTTKVPWSFESVKSLRSSISQIVISYKSELAQGRISENWEPTLEQLDRVINVLMLNASTQFKVTEVAKQQIQSTSSPTPSSSLTISNTSTPKMRFQIKPKESGPKQQIAQIQSKITRDNSELIDLKNYFFQGDRGFKYSFSLTDFNSLNQNSASYMYQRSIVLESLSKILNKIETESSSTEEAPAIASKENENDSKLSNKEKSPEGKSNLEVIGHQGLNDPGESDEEISSSDEQPKETVASSKNKPDADTLESSSSNVTETHDSKVSASPQQGVASEIIARERAKSILMSSMKRDSQKKMRISKFKTDESFESTSKKEVDALCQEMQSIGKVLNLKAKIDGYNAECSNLKDQLKQAKLEKGIKEQFKLVKNEILKLGLRIEPLVKNELFDNVIEIRSNLELLKSENEKNAREIKEDIIKWRDPKENNIVAFSKLENLITGLYQEYNLKGSLNKAMDASLFVYAKKMAGTNPEVKNAFETNYYKAKLPNNIKGLKFEDCPGEIQVRINGLLAKFQESPAQTNIDASQSSIKDKAI